MYMAHDTKPLEKELEGTKHWLLDELRALRTGRATPALLDGVSLEVYGTRMKLGQVASISVEGARSLYVMPYDAEQVKAIEKAITAADLGVSAGSDERGVRVSFPELTAERRGQLVKILKGKLEDARIGVRQKRTEAMNDIEKREKAGEVGKDEAHRSKDAVQKAIDAANVALEEMANKKEQELQQ